MCGCDSRRHAGFIPHQSFLMRMEGTLLVWKREETAVCQTQSAYVSPTLNLVGDPLFTHVHTYRVDRLAYNKWCYLVRFIAFLSYVCMNQKRLLYKFVLVHDLPQKWRLGMSCIN